MWEVILLFVLHDQYQFHSFSSWRQSGADAMGEASSTLKTWTRKLCCSNICFRLWQGWIMSKTYSVVGGLKHRTKMKTPPLSRWYHPLLLCTCSPTFVQRHTENLFSRSVGNQLTHSKLHQRACNRCGRLVSSTRILLQDFQPRKKD